jgi:hypothetical protein
MIGEIGKVTNKKSRLHALGAQAGLLNGTRYFVGG